MPFHDALPRLFRNASELAEDTSCLSQGLYFIVPMFSIEDFAGPQFALNNMTKCSNSVYGI